MRCGRRGTWTRPLLEYRKALAIRSDYSEAHNNLGVALAARGDWEKAAVEYRKAVALNSYFTAAHYNLGVAFAAKEQLEPGYC